MRPPPAAIMQSLHTGRAQRVCHDSMIAGEAGAVLEGRDIGTAVFPEAPVKVFLDASADVRAARRAGDTDAGVEVSGSASSTVAAVAADLARRDRLDSSRATSPLQAAGDAVHLDSSTMDAQQVVDVVLDLARRAGLA